VLPLAAALLLVQGVSETLKSLYALVRGRRP
jgi:TRAP-type mannitol/chloroaromatic compound transport system permease small subunit